MTLSINIDTAAAWTNMCDVLRTRPLLNALDVSDCTGHVDVGDLRGCVMLEEVFVRWQAITVLKRVPPDLGDLA